MPEAVGGCLGDLGLDKRQLLKGWPDLWLAGDNGGQHGRPPRRRRATTARARPNPSTPGHATPPRAHLPPGAPPCAGEKRWERRVKIGRQKSGSS
jgi:hypothetical protein